jgi:hypothetical protein
MVCGAASSIALLASKNARRLISAGDWGVNKTTARLYTGHQTESPSNTFLFLALDMALLVLASGLYRRMARRMRGYDDAQARQIFRDLIDIPADVAITDNEITVQFHRRAHLPIVLASGLFDKPVNVPWWNSRSLRLIQ